MFTVLQSQANQKEPKNIDYKSIYERMFLNAFRKYTENINNGNKIALYQAIFAGVKYINSIDKREIRTLNEAQLLYETVNAIKNLMSLLTPNELTQIFPVSKRYDGTKWETKDYFFTMEVLNEYGLDTPLGKELDEILWDYRDCTLFKFQSKIYHIFSLLYKADTGRTPMQEFFEGQGVETYTIHTDEKTGREFLVDNKGKSTMIKKKLPRYLKVVEG